MGAGRALTYDHRPSRPSRNTYEGGDVVCDGVLDFVLRVGSLRAENFAGSSPDTSFQFHECVSGVSPPSLALPPLSPGHGRVFLSPRKPRKTTVRFAGRPFGLTVAIWKYLAYGMCFAEYGRSRYKTEYEHVMHGVKRWSCVCVCVWVCDERSRHGQEDTPGCHPPPVHGCNNRNDLFLPPPPPLSSSSPHFVLLDCVEDGGAPRGTHGG